MNPIVVLSSSAWIVLSSSSGVDWCLSSLPLRMSWTRCCGVAIVISISGCGTILLSKSVWGIVPSSFLQLIGRRMYHVAVQMLYCICGIVLVIPFPSLPPLLLSLLCCLCQARVAMSACGNVQVLVLFVPPPSGRSVVVSISITKPENFYLPLTCCCCRVLICCCHSCCVVLLCGASLPS